MTSISLQTTSQVRSMPTGSRWRKRAGPTCPGALACSSASHRRSSIASRTTKTWRGAREKAGFLHASCTEWKNLFDFEIFLHNAKVQISGLGRSYGT